MMWMCSSASLAAWLLIAGAVPDPALSDTETVEVARYDGSLQCEEGSGISLTKMQQDLTDQGIEVFSSRRSRDCLMRTQVCGQKTGMINVYRIKKDRLDVSVSFGFRPLADFCE
jgi:hypothetical protein